MNIKNYKCIGCGSKNIKVVVNFGEFPIATTYSNYADEKVKTNLDKWKRLQTKSVKKKPQ